MNAKGIIKRTIKDSTLKNLLKENIREYYGKRAVDLFISIPLLIISVPLMLTIAFFIKLGSKGPILFKQTRLGKAGKPFIFYKFRTMYHGQSERSHKEYMNNIIKNGNSPNGIYKMTNDKRVTSFGYLLRILSLGEFPQLVNVLKGEMSLVGPRPPIPYEVKVYEDWHKARLLIKPGITGFWQVMGRSLLPFNDMVMLDLYYSSNQSFLMDMIIMMKTIPAVFSLKGAY